MPDAHISAIEHALMRHIRHLDQMLPAGDLTRSPTYADLAAQRDASIAALAAINPTLAAIWSGEGRT